MRVVVCVLVVAVLTSLCCGAGFFDEDEAERELIRETTLPFSEMFLGLRVEKVVTGGYFSAALLSNNSVLMQGMGQPLRLLNGSFVDIGAGTYDLLAVEEGEVLHVLSLRDDGPAGQLRPLKSGVRAFCGGFEDFRIMLENRPAQLCCGSNYALQRTDDGRVLGTGSNAWGVLREGKNGSTSDGWVELPSLRSVTQLACGGDHALARTSDGRVLAWGWSEMGQLGGGAGAGLLEVALPGKAALVWAGGYGHSGAVLEGGEAWGWGWSRQGQLGQPTEELFLPPHKMEALGGDVLAVSSGSFKHTVIQRRDKTCVGVGSNAFLQIKNV